MGENDFGIQGFWSRGRWTCPNNCTEMVTCRPGKRSTTVLFLIFFVILPMAAFICWTDHNVTAGVGLYRAIINSRSTKNSLGKFEYQVNCSSRESGSIHTCSVTNYPFGSSVSATSCPDYFRWIHEDLLPWKNTGITRDMMERAKDFAHFRLVIVNGKVYVEKFKKAFQTRDVFTIWGILQLLRLYPGMVPDLELMFGCEDKPLIKKRDFQGPNATWNMPAMFHYCGDDTSLGIVFPDWSFWGWPETNIKPWKFLMEDIKEGRRRSKWEDRVPYAYWKGNPHTGPARADLMKCIVSDKYDWNARLYSLDWDQEIEKRCKDTKLEDQCTHRYKIYVEGWAWSVSEKYILACDSPTLLIKPRYFDFFTRGMIPMQHYWPISSRNKCRNIKFAVEWGNNHTYQADAIGKAGSKFVEDYLKMEYVYDYMFHSLSEYEKLLKFKPTVPLGVEEVCSETMACSEDGLWRQFMMQSMVKSPSQTLPCNLPPAYEPPVLQAFVEGNENIAEQVEMWATEYWETQNKKQ